MVRSASIAIGDDAVGDGDTGCGRCGDGSASAEVDVIGVGRHDENSFDVGIVKHVFPHKPARFPGGSRDGRVN